MEADAGSYYKVLGADDPKAGEYIERWLAFMFQKPAQPAEVALVFRGEEGTGKGMLGRAVLEIFGPHAMPISQQQELVGGFSGHFLQCMFLFVDEAFWAGNHAVEGRLKSLLTEKAITIRPLYHQAMTVPNLLHVMMASNNDWVVPAGPQARRYQVFDVSEARMQDAGYFGRLQAELDGGGREAMLWDLLRLDLEGWHPRQIYRTAALIEQRQHSLRGADAVIEGWLQDGVLPEAWPKYPNRALSKNLLAAVREQDRYANDTQLANKLKRLFAVEPYNNQSSRGWIFPELDECRRLWEARHGGEWLWHRDLAEWGEKSKFNLDAPLGA